MAPYEQKTDSREFELANSALPSAGPGSISTPDPTDILIQLWGLEGYHQPKSLTWETESICIYMIADLVSASRGTTAENSAGFMTAHFEGCTQALVAAKRIQIAILEFLSGGPGEAVGAAILIHQPRSTAQFGEELLATSLAQARPGQILIPENLSREWERVPGMEFRPVELTAASESSAVSFVEVVWSTAEQMDQLHAAGGTAAPNPSAFSIPMAATMIGSLPAETSRLGTSDHRASSEAATVDFAFQNHSETYASSNAGAHATGEMNSAEMAGSPEAAGNLLLEDLDREDRSFLTPGRAFVGSAAVVLLAAFIAVMYWPIPGAKSPHHTPANSAGEPANAVTTPAADSRGTTLVAPRAATPKAPESPALPKAPAPGVGDTKVPVQEHKLPKNLPGSQPASPMVQVTNKPKAGNPEPTQPPAEVTGYSRKDIPQLLKMAASNVGAGRYDDARLAYRKILQLQPDNQEAKDGLHKLDLIQRDNSDQ